MGHDDNLDMPYGPDPEPFDDDPVDGPDWMDVVKNVFGPAAVQKVRQKMQMGSAAKLGGVTIDNMKGQVPGKRLRMLVYGPAGVGKTYFGASMPNPLFLDVDDGMETLVGDDVDRILCNSWESFTKSVDAVVLGAQSMEYETIVVDTVTLLQRHLKLHVMATQNRDKMEIQDWDTMLNEMTRWLTKLTQLPQHLLILAHSREIPVDGGLPHARVDMQGRYEGDIERIVSVIGYMELVNKTGVGEDGKLGITSQERLVHLVAHNRTAKNRSKLLEGRDSISVEELAKLAASLPTRKGDQPNADLRSEGSDGDGEVRTPTSGVVPGDDSGDEGEDVVDGKPSPVSTLSGSGSRTLRRPKS